MREALQVFHREGMHARNGKFFIAVIKQSPSQFPGIDREIVTLLR